jgi:CheY-like chemotaxis protein
VVDRLRSNKVAPKILIADDDPCVLRAIADRCTRMGFDVETATNGLQVLIKASQHEPDILVIDAHMPEVGGLSVLSYLPDAKKKSLHVVVVTGNPSQEIVRNQGRAHRIIFERCGDPGRGVRLLDGEPLFVGIFRGATFCVVQRGPKMVANLTGQCALSSASSA